MCLSHVFISPWIPIFRAKHWSLYSKVSVLFHKWPISYSGFLVWVCTHEWRTIPPSGVEGGRGGCVHEVCSKKLVGGMDSNGWGCAGVRKNILTREFYWATIIPKPEYQYGSWVRKVLGNQSARIIWEYNLATPITIRPLTQPFTWKMDSSVLEAVIPIQSCKCNLGLLTHNPINGENEWEGIGSNDCGSSDRDCPS